jgi:hypothetical protein
VTGRRRRWRSINNIRERSSSNDDEPPGRGPPGRGPPSRFLLDRDSRRREPEYLKQNQWLAPLDLLVEEAGIPILSAERKKRQFPIEPRGLLANSLRHISTRRLLACVFYSGGEAVCG